MSCTRRKVARWPVWCLPRCGGAAEHGGRGADTGVKTEAMLAVGLFLGAGNQLAADCRCPGALCVVCAARPVTLRT